MHRSGTSMITNLFQENGIYVGSEDALIAKAEDNPQGFGERTDLVLANDELLNDNGLGWSSLANFDSTTFSQESISKYKTQISPIIDQLNKEKSWILKDPRLSVIFPYFYDCLDESTKNDLKIIRVTRSPLEVAKSLNKRNNFPIQQSLALWEFYNIQILKDLKGYKFHSINYNDTLSNPSKELESLQLFLDNEIDFKQINFDNKLHRNKTTEYFISDQKELFHEQIINNTIDDSKLNTPTTTLIQLSELEEIHKLLNELAVSNIRLGKLEHKTSILDNAMKSIFNSKKWKLANILMNIKNIILFKSIKKDPNQEIVTNIIKSFNGI